MEDEDFKTPIDYISEIRELVEISKFMQDDKLDEALSLMVKLTVKSDVPPGAAARLVVKLQALAGVMSAKGKYHMLFKPEADSPKKKNVYLSVADSLNNLVNAVKYSVRA